ncbi:MAG: ribosomal protein S18-alanine N-acetyltransferase [Micrococcales bacterium]|nr:ribosomal protein S18-alanine N-acetyltransferase [Micrococcales bacterium]
MALERATFPDDAWSEATMREELGSHRGGYLIAEDPERPDEVAGYGGLAAHPGSGTADIQTLAVAPWARRRGLGRAILRALLAEAEARGAGEVLLEVRADNPEARALYTSEGFEEIAQRPRYYPGGVAALVMRRPR